MASAEETSKRKLVVIQGDSSTSGSYWEESRSLTFVLEGEDHTLGNSLRYIVMKNPDVEFCGYNIPHPTESRINFRIQSRGPPAVSILKKGLLELSRACDHVLATFEENVSEYKDDADDKMEA